MTNTPPDDPVAAAAPSIPAPAEPRARLNALAVAALILAVLLSPLAALFGHIAAHQIARSNGRERGTAIAWVAVGLGYLWLIVVFIVAVTVWRFFTN
jgi:mannose/fructose/N-acetylgalactosamine-specific phosphotransferase system component IIC